MKYLNNHELEINQAYDNNSSQPFSVSSNEHQNRNEINSYSSCDEFISNNQGYEESNQEIAFGDTKILGDYDQEDKKLNLNISLTYFQKDKQSNSNNNSLTDFQEYAQKKENNLSFFPNKYTISNSSYFQEIEQKNNFNFIFAIKKDEQFIDDNNSKTTFKLDEKSNQNINIKNLTSHSEDKKLLVSKETKYPKKKNKKKKTKKKDKLKSETKRLLNKVKEKHTKNSQDNLIRKGKVYFIDDFICFINKKISKKNFSIKINNKEVNKILNLEPSITKDVTIDTNKELFEKPMKDLLKKNSRKYKTLPENSNEIIIDELCKNKNYNDIKEILNITYLDCLKYYRKDDLEENEKTKLSCLKGLEKKFEKLPQKMKEKFERLKKRCEEKYKDKKYDQIHQDNIIKTIKNLDIIYIGKSLVKEE